MKPIPLGISVNAWNAVKFVLFELFFSVLFVSAWNLFLRRALARKLRNSTGVRLVPSGLGRFTPTEVGFYTTKRLTWRATSGDARLHVYHRRTQAIIIAFNLLLFALLLEYDRTDLPSVESRKAAVVTAASIRAHSLRTAQRAGIIVKASKSVKQGFQPESRNALRTVTDIPGALSPLELLEHTVDDGSELESPRVAAKFKSVCGDNNVTQIPQCAAAHASFLSKNSINGLMVIARGTRVHRFADSNHRIYDIDVEHSISLNHTSDADKIDMRWLGLVGALTGHSLYDKTVTHTKTEATVESDACVLRETRSTRIFALFLRKLISCPLRLYEPNLTLHKRPGGSGPFVVSNSTIVFEKDEAGVLSFVPSVNFETYTAVLGMQEHQSCSTTPW